MICWFCGRPNDHKWHIIPGRYFHKFTNGRDGIDPFHVAPSPAPVPEGLREGRYRCIKCGRNEYGCECEGGGDMERAAPVAPDRTEGLDVEALDAARKAAADARRNPARGYHNAYHDEHGSWCQPCPYEDIPSEEIAREYAAIKEQTHAE